MAKRSIICAAVFLLVFVFSGCAVRTYSVYKERPDLDLSSGNRGFLKGKSQAPAAVAKTTRENKVIEVEIFPLIKSLKRDKSKPVVKGVVNQKDDSEGQREDAGKLVAQEYTVGPNDTLQKISQKFYGSMHKWSKIYEANKDQLKGPDKIKPGQVLKIPTDTVKTLNVEAPKEPVENLK